MELGVHGMDDLAPENTPADIEVPKPLGDRNGNALRRAKMRRHLGHLNWPAKAALGRPGRDNLPPLQLPRMLQLRW